eukprot:GHVS01020865.1.p1 GENE.GHVS01020865.1~~GHVS01020865.1.p1  ORF type:complete len:151 (+),score=24.18 GHVS01020865.1:57-509(+)
MTGFWWNTRRVFTENEAIQATYIRLCEELQTVDVNELSIEQIDACNKNRLCRRPTLLGMGSLWLTFVSLRKIDKRPFKTVITQLAGASPVGLLVFSFTRHYIDFQFVKALLGDRDLKLSAKLRKTYCAHAGPQSSTVSQLVEAERIQTEV